MNVNLSKLISLKTTEKHLYSSIKKVNWWKKQRKRNFHLITYHIFSNKRPGSLKQPSPKNAHFILESIS